MKKLLLLAALVVGTSPVWALSYEIGNGSVSAYNPANSNNGLAISTSVFANVAGLDFSIDDGDSFTFNFFKIWTPETDVGWDDTKKKTITATLNFLTPVASAVVGGNTQGVLELFGIVQYGQVIWNGPAVVDAGDRVFKVSLSNETFNSGLFGLNEGYCSGAVVQATVTQCSHVPDGGLTIALFGSALLGLVAIRRRIA